MFGLIEQYLLNRRLKQKVRLISVQFESDCKVYTTTVDFGESITFGEALTRVMDARDDKNSKLVSW